MNFKNENNNNENMNNEIELNNNKGDIKMKLISEISTAQSKRFYNNKQTLRPIINNGQLKVIKTEVNKEALTYNEVTLRSGTINQLKHGVYDFYTKKTFKPQLINLNEFDEITLNINDIQKIKELRWAVYPHKSLNKNNPYYAKTGYLWGYQVVFIQQLYDEEVKLKVVAKDIEVILWLEELKNLKVSDLDHIGKLNQKELNDLKAIQYNLTDYDKPIYEETEYINGVECAISDAKARDGWEYEVKDSPDNVVKNKRMISRAKSLEQKIEYVEAKMLKIKRKNIDLKKVYEYIIKDGVIDEINQYANKGEQLFKKLSYEVDPNGIMYTEINGKIYLIDDNGKVLKDCADRPIEAVFNKGKIINKEGVLRYDYKIGVPLTALWSIYHELTYKALDKELNELKIQREKISNEGI